MATSKIRKPLGFIVRAGVSLLLLWWLVRQLDLAALGSVLRGARWRLVAWAWVLLLLSRWVTVTKWNALLRAKGMAFPYGYLLRVVWVSNFLGHFLPGAIGGDNIRMFTVARQVDRAPEAVSTVLVERITGTVSLAALAVCGGCWSFFRWGRPDILLALSLPLGLLLAGLALLWTPLGERWMGWGLRRLKGLPGHRFLAELHEAVRSFRDEPGPVGFSLGLSVVNQLLRVGSVFLCAQALGLPLRFGEALVLVPAILFISMLPITVAGLGVREGAFVLLLRLAAVGTAAAFGLSLVHRLAQIASNLPGLVFLFTHGMERPTYEPVDRAPRPAAGNTEQDHASFHPPGGTNGSPAQRGSDDAVRRIERPIRVLRVIDKLGYGGCLHGPGRMWLNSLETLEASGCHVTPCVLRLHAGIKAQFAHRNLQLVDLRRSRFDPFTIWSLVRLIRRHRINLLHLQGFGATTLGRIAGVLTGTPAVIHHHDTEPRVPWYVRWADRWLASRTARVIAVSRAVGALCVTRRHLMRDQVVIVPNGVGPEWAQPVPAEPLNALRQLLGIPAGVVVVGAVTRFRREKDVTTLLSAIALLRGRGRSCHLVLVGDGPDRRRIEGACELLGLSTCVHLVGSQEDVQRYLGLMDVVAFTGLTEGCPNALLEAMAAGRPVVVVDTRPMGELVRDGVEGVIVRPKDPDALAAGLERLLDDRELAKRLGERARSTALTYSIPAHVQRLREVYEAVVAERQLSNGTIRRGEDSGGGAPALARGVRASARALGLWCRVRGGFPALLVQSLVRGKLRDRRCWHARRRNEFQLRTADGTTTARLHLPFGRGVSPALILVHGSHGPLALYGLLADRLAGRGVCVLEVDLPCFGRSSAPEQPWRPEQFTGQAQVAAARGFLEAHPRVDRRLISIFGHSMGGSAAVTAGRGIPGWHTVIALGPTRRVEERFLGPAAPEAEWMQARFTTGRRLRRRPDPELVRAVCRAEALEYHVGAWQSPKHPPLLLLDGEYEAAADRSFLAGLARHLSQPAAYRTIPKADHYLNSLSLGRWVCYDRRAVETCVSWIAEWVQDHSTAFTALNATTLTRPVITPQSADLTPVTVHGKG